MKHGILIVAVLWSAGSRAEFAVLAPSDACSGSFEAWTLPASLAHDLSKDLDAYLRGQRTPVEGFADALALRKSPGSVDERWFAEYITANALYRMRFLPSAQSAFGVIASREAPSAFAASVRGAAMACLVRIQETQPTFELPDGVPARLATEEGRRGARPDVIAAVASIELRRRIGMKAQRKDLEPWLTLAKSDVDYGNLAATLAAAHSGQIEATVDSARAWLKPASHASGIARFEDDVRVLLGRSLFAGGDYAGSAAAFQQVKKSSNSLARSLSELAWAQLRDARYTEAIGTAINLNSGGLRRTFAPEAPMVMAMAFHELCHYPPSLQAVQYFKTAYGPSYEWLKEWNKRSAPSAGLYADTVAHLKHKSTVPARVVSEWIRSPHFITRQAEINLWSGQAANANKIAQSARDHQKVLAIELLALVRSIRPRFEKFKGENPEGKLPSFLAQDIERLRRMSDSYRRLRASAGPWQSVVKSQASRAAPRRTKLVGEIEREIASLNLRMSLQIDEVAENMRFLEAEIYEGATQDIIWQNAYPDYKKLVLTFDRDSRAVAASKSWNWGSLESGLEGNHEIWEDELGSFQADLFDNCSSKDKYLAVKADAVIKKAKENKK